MTTATTFVKSSKTTKTAHLTNGDEKTLCGKTIGDRWVGVDEVASDTDICSECLAVEGQHNHPGETTDEMTAAFVEATVPDTDQYRCDDAQMNAYAARYDRHDDEPVNIATGLTDRQAYGVDANTAAEEDEITAAMDDDTMPSDEALAEAHREYEEALAEQDERATGGDAAYDPEALIDDPIAVMRESVRNDAFIEFATLSLATVREKMAAFKTLYGREAIVYIDFVTDRAWDAKNQRFVGERMESLAKTVKVKTSWVRVRVDDREIDIEGKDIHTFYFV